MVALGIALPLVDGFRDECVVSLEEGFQTLSNFELTRS